jgi:hypothetical protein
VRGSEVPREVQPQQPNRSESERFVDPVVAASSCLSSAGATLGTRESGKNTLLPDRRRTPSALAISALRSR